MGEIIMHDLGEITSPKMMVFTIKMSCRFSEQMPAGQEGGGPGRAMQPLHARSSTDHLSSEQSPGAKSILIDAPGKILLAFSAEKLDLLARARSR
jgi:hypothetical protein